MYNKFTALTGWTSASVKNRDFDTGWKGFAERLEEDNTALEALLQRVKNGNPHAKANLEKLIAANILSPEEVRIATSTLTNHFNISCAV